MEFEQLPPGEQDALRRAWVDWVKRVGGPKAEEQGGRMFMAGWLACHSYYSEAVAAAKRSW